MAEFEGKDQTARSRKKSDMRRMEKMEYFSRVENLSKLAQKISDTLDRNPGLIRREKDPNGIDFEELGLQLRKATTIREEDGLSPISQIDPFYKDSEASPQKIALRRKSTPKVPRSPKVVPKGLNGAKKSPAPDLKSLLTISSESEGKSPLPPRLRNSRKKKSSG